MKALVTGGAGFIGSNLVKRLMEDGHDVVVIDDLSSGYIMNIEPYITTDRVRFINASINDAHAAKEACFDRDVVFHMAACVGRQRSLDDPIMDASTNILGTINILEAMRKCKVPRIVYSSSAAIFGELLTVSIDENHPQNADSPYGISKLAAEKMIIAYSNLYGIKSICLRYFNIYGVNQRFDLYGNVIPIFAKRIFSNEPVTIYGDGTQTRDFLNVADVVKANLIAGTKNSAQSATYNLGSGVSVSIQYLAEIMHKIANKPVKIAYAPERMADVKHCNANIDKVKAELGFSVQIQLYQGLEEYMKWYQHNCLEV